MERACQPEERGGWSRGVGAEAEELPLFLPTPSFVVSAGKRED